jgi:hypothetical protein
MPMQVPPGLLQQPTSRLTNETKAEFDAAFRELLREPAVGAVVLPERHPKWEFLSYVCESQDVVLHGSSHMGLTQIGPRQADDVRACSSQTGIYATTDGIWAIFFAIVNRREREFGMANTCFTVTLDSGETVGPFYYFSISQHALDADPWTEGAVYLLPRASFSQERPQRHEEGVVGFPHWIGKTATTPYGFLPVGPDDFPFLGEVRGHDDEEQRRRYQEDPNWRPWNV